MGQRYLISKADDDLLERVRIVAFECRLTKAGLVREAVKQFLARHRRRQTRRRRYQAEEGR